MIGSGVSGQIRQILVEPVQKKSKVKHDHFSMAEQEGCLIANPSDEEKAIASALMKCARSIAKQHKKKDCVYVALTSKHPYAESGQVVCALIDLYTAKPRSKSLFPIAAEGNKFAFLTKPVSRQ